MAMTAMNLAGGLAILGVKAFALFLMVLGAIDLWTHVKGEK